MMGCSILLWDISIIYLKIVELETKKVVGIELSSGESKL